MFGLFQKTSSDYKNLNADDFRKAFEHDKNAVVLDVRTPAEAHGGKIKGAKVINFMDPGFATAISKLDPSKSYYVYCRSGVRSANACQIMAKNGFKELYNLRGGVLDWPFQLI
ncbi:MAG: rhodanese-like domain-containing protein [Saprospiraceae bacterium]|nr:rhodanese-like domain-containing protein [Saprospiraceae bacterium]